MTETKRRLPAIAIVLAIIAVGMLSLAIYTRTRRAAGTAPIAPRDAGIPRSPMLDAPEPDIDAAVPAPAPDPGACIPCGACKPTTCRCADGVLSTSMRCVNGCCDPPASTCADTCKVHGGVAP